MERYSRIIASLIQAEFGFDGTVSLNRPDEKFGDLTTNIALQLAKSLNQNPRQIAKLLAEKLHQTDEFAEVSIAGLGFINLRIKDSVLAVELEKIISNPSDYGRSSLYEDKIIVAEYSDPNPFKVLHVGHLYTSIVGDAISNLIETAGGQVHRVNFGGDVGLHVGKTLWAIMRQLGGENPDKLSDINENERSDWMAACYVEGTRHYDKDEQAKAEITLLNKKIYQIQADDDYESGLARIYWTCRQWSYDYFDAFYKRIGTKFEKYYPESEVAELGLKTVLEQKDKGVYQESNGAIIFAGDVHNLHTRVFVNNEGIPTYETKDVGLSLQKWQDYHYDESIIVTDHGQLEYMKVVQKSIEQFRPDLAQRTKHLTHGVVKLFGGVKMASRKGNFLKAVDVLQIVANEIEAQQGSLSDEPVLGAVKYTFLKNRIGSDIIFDPAESVSLRGNSGPYLQYSLVRAKSIMNKSPEVEPKVTIYSYSQAERALLFKLTEYSSVIQQATTGLTPHLVCTYLHELTQVFSRFYENSPVIGNPKEVFRLQLVSAYKGILTSGLKILGIPMPDKM
jgi:arginyl-tRNA synthetase